MKRCELCGQQKATTFCKPDGASLCRRCDEKVHSANFLVAKHSRTLLCHRCQSPTPLKLSGTSLPISVTFCRTCVRSSSKLTCNKSNAMSPCRVPNTCFQLYPINKCANAARACVWTTAMVHNTPPYNKQGRADEETTHEIDDDGEVIEAQEDDSNFEAVDDEDEDH